MLNRERACTICQVFCMTRPDIVPRSTSYKANILPLGKGRGQQTVSFLHVHFLNDRPHFSNAQIFTARAILDTNLFVACFGMQRMPWCHPGPVPLSPPKHTSHVGMTCILAFICSIMIILAKQNYSNYDIMLGQG